MDNQQAYNAWASSYDTIESKTRDLEAAALRRSVSRFDWTDVLEIGCGTGKNTEWLAMRAAHLTGADFSAEMPAKASDLELIDLSERFDDDDKKNGSANFIDDFQNEKNEPASFPANQPPNEKAGFALIRKVGFLRVKFFL